jgi:hypothetical protein
MNPFRSRQIAVLYIAMWVGTTIVAASITGGYTVPLLVTLMPMLAAPWTLTVLDDASRDAS